MRPLLINDSGTEINCPGAWTIYSFVFRDNKQTSRRAKHNRIYSYADAMLMPLQCNQEINTASISNFDFSCIFSAIYFIYSTHEIVQYISKLGQVLSCVKLHKLCNINKLDILHKINSLCRYGLFIGTLERTFSAFIRHI